MAVHLIWNSTLICNIETIEAIAEIVDAELIEDIEYLSMGKTPADRVKTLLAKLDSVRSSQERGSEVSSQSKALFHKFVEQVDQIFQNLPKSLEWRSFYTHDLTLIVDICKEVQNISIQHNLNKSQTRALAKLNAVSENEFQRIVNPQPSSQKIEPSSDNQPSTNRALSDFSATEIETIANKEIQKEVLAEQGRSRIMPHLSSEVKILLLNILGIPEKVAERVSSLFNLDKDYITGRGRQRDRVRARDLLCYWCAIELRIPMADLSKRLDLTLAAVSYAVKRGEKVAKEAGCHLND